MKPRLVDHVHRVWRVEPSTVVESVKIDAARSAESNDFGMDRRVKKALVLCARTSSQRHESSTGAVAETGLPGVASDRHKQGELPTIESTWVLFEARALRGRVARKASSPEGTEDG